jgi:hypothetical protein
MPDGKDRKPTVKQLGRLVVALREFTNADERSHYGSGWQQEPPFRGSTVQ